MSVATKPQSDGLVLRVDDQRPRYHEKTTYEVIARSGLTEVVFYLGCNPVRAIERLADAQESEKHEFAWMNIYIPSEEPKEQPLLLECAGYRNTHPRR